MSGHLILVVDDHDFFRRKAATFIEQAGHRCVTAATYVEAMARLEEETPCGIVADIHIPYDVDHAPDAEFGHKFIRDVRADFPHGKKVLYILGISATDKRARDAAFAMSKLGCDHYLEKDEKLAPEVQRLVSYCRGHEKPEVTGRLTAGSWREVFVHLTGSGVSISVTGGGRKLDVVFGEDVVRGLEHLKAGKRSQKLTLFGLPQDKAGDKASYLRKALRKHVEVSGSKANPVRKTRTPRGAVGFFAEFHFRDKHDGQPIRSVKVAKRGGEGRYEDLQFPGVLALPWRLDRRASSESEPFLLEPSSEPDARRWGREATLVYWSHRRPERRPSAEIEDAAPVDSYWLAQARP